MGIAIHIAFCVVFALIGFWLIFCTRNAPHLYAKADRRVGLFFLVLATVYGAALGLFLWFISTTLERF